MPPLTLILLTPSQYHNSSPRPRRKRQLPSHPPKYLLIILLLLHLHNPHPHQKINHNHCTIRLKLTLLHPLPHLLHPHQIKPLHLIIPRLGHHFRPNLQIIHIHQIPTHQPPARFHHLHIRNCPHGFCILADQRLRKRCFFICFVDDGFEGCFCGFDPPCDGCVVFSRVGKQTQAALRDPDLEFVVSSSCIHGHVRAAGDDAEERRGVALEMHEPGETGDEVRFAVFAVQDGEVVFFYGAVDYGCEGGVAEV
ncbi:hypothetical protein ACMFMF_011933 [Clarireedia jacksonii]